MKRVQPLYFRPRLQGASPALRVGVRRSRIRIEPTPSRRYRRSDPALPWKILFFIVAGFLTVLAVNSEAAPPFSRGARPIALGNGYTAMAGDGYALHYNPAGLYLIDQKEWIADFGRSYSQREPARSDFNGIFAQPWQYKGRSVPIAVGVYGEQPADGAHIIDITVGAATEAPVEKWTRGFLRTPARGGLALTVRHQNGDDISDRVGSSAIGLGLTGGLFFPLDRKNQAGVAIRNLFAGDADSQGASISAGFLRHHRPYLTVLADLEYGRGGVWRFKPGLEWIFMRGVLRPRLGWGFRDNGGIDTVATGIGFYLSPVQIDITYLVPIKTLSDNAGQLRASLIYRFGDRQFTEIYYDRALEAASSLDKNVLDLTIREAELKSSVAELEQKTFLAQEELQNARSRIESLKDKDVLAQKENEIKRLKDRVRNLESALSSYRARAAAASRKKEVRKHRVQSGDTLQNLAVKFYGDPNEWKRIYNANADKIDRGLPRVGETLVIP